MALSRHVSRGHARRFACCRWETGRVCGHGPVSRRSWENRRILAVCRHSAIAATSRDDPFLIRLSALHRAHRNASDEVPPRSCVLVERQERENDAVQTGTLPKGLVVQVKKNTGGLLHGSVY